MLFYLYDSNNNIMKKATKIIKTVKMTNTINIAGFNHVTGMEMKVTKEYFRNGESQYRGFIDGRTKIEEVPAIWTK